MLVPASERPRGRPRSRDSPSRATPTRTSCGSSTSVSRRSEEHTSELQSPCNLVCRLLLEKKKKIHCSQGRTCTLTHAPPTYNAQAVATCTKVRLPFVLPPEDTICVDVHLHSRLSAPSYI